MPSFLNREPGLIARFDTHHTGETNLHAKHSVLRLLFS